MVSSGGSPGVLVMDMMGSLRVRYGDDIIDEVLEEWARLNVISLGISRLSNFSSLQWSLWSLHAWFPPISSFIPLIVGVSDIVMELMDSESVCSEPQEVLSELSIGM